MPYAYYDTSLSRKNGFPMYAYASTSRVLANRTFVYQSAPARRRFPL